MISFFAIFIAASFNALCDRVQDSIQFNNSIFSRRNPEFWCRTISAHAVKFIRFTRYRPDAWHLSKSVSIVLICIAVVVYEPVFIYLDFLILGITWNIGFNLFYNRILKKKA